MSSFPKTKLAVKSDPWFIDANIIRTVGFQESPIFGTELTKFYMRAERDEIFFHLRLYLAACKEEKVQVVVNLFSGFNNPPTSEDCQNGEISLDKTKKILIGLWSVSLFVSSEVIFEESDSVLQQKHYEALSSQLLNLRENSNSSDIVLVTTVDRREFQAHKNILASRSAVFSAMFQHGNFIENKKNRVEIDDVTGEVMDALLRYIYSADVQGIEKIAEHLLPAADKYDIPLLMDACVKTLQASLSVENALRFFILADLHHLEAFKEEVVKFIEPNLAAIRESADWEKCINLQLLQQLFDLLLVSPKK